MPRSAGLGEGGALSRRCCPERRHTVYCAGALDETKRRASERLGGFSFMFHGPVVLCSRDGALKAREVDVMQSRMS